MSFAVKELLASAAKDGQADSHWTAEGVDRLYFNNPTDVNAAGYVEVARSAPTVDGNGVSLPPAPPPYVKIELWVPPTLAAEVIALVTGNLPTLETRLRYELGAELAREAAAWAEVAEKAQAEAEAKVAVEAEAARAQTPGRVAVARTRQEVADAARSVELKELIALQGEDDE